MIKRIVPILILFFVLTAPASASPFFYTGDVIVKAIDANINITDSASVLVNYTLVNGGEATETLNLSLAENQASVRLELAPNETKVISFNYTLPISEDGATRILSFNPILNFNNKPSAERVSEVNIKVLLPKNINKLSGYNKEPVLRSVGEEGRIAYLWAFQDVYPTMLTIRWATLNVSIELTKTASPTTIDETNNLITVNLSVENLREEKITNLILYQDFDPVEFIPVEPNSEFTFSETSLGDRRLIWMKRISLDAKERKEVLYKIRYVGSAAVPFYTLDLKETFAIANDTIVASSNPAFVQVRQTPPSNVTSSGETQEIGDLVNWALVLFLTFLLIGFLIWLKRRREGD